MPEGRPGCCPPNGAPPRPCRSVVPSWWVAASLCHGLGSGGEGCSKGLAPKDAVTAPPGKRGARAEAAVTPDVWSWVWICLGPQKLEEAEAQAVPARFSRGLRWKMSDFWVCDLNGAAGGNGFSSMSPEALV